MIYWIRLLFASLCPVAGIVPKLGLVQLFPTSLVVVSRRGSGRTVVSTVFRTGCLKTERLCIVSLRQSFSVSLREAIITASSSVVCETSSSTIFGWTHMISYCHWNEALAFCFSAIGLTTSSLVLSTGVNPSWSVAFGKVSKLRVTIFVVTFFCSDLRVKTLASTNTLILSLRTKHPAGGVMHHSVKEAIVGITCTSHLFRSSDFR